MFILCNENRETCVVNVIVNSQCWQCCLYHLQYSQTQLWFWISKGKYKIWYLNKIIMSPWKIFLNLTIFLISCFLKNFSLLWQNENNILNISYGRNNMTNVVKTLWRSVYARGFFFNHLLYQKIRTPHWEKIIKTYLVCLELETLPFVVKIYYKDGVSGEMKSILLFHCCA